MNENIFKFLALNNDYELIGSSKHKIKYISDYDLQNTVKKIDHNKILKQFQDKFIQAEKKNGWYITDFKCGIFNNTPVRWKKDDIMRGYIDLAETKRVMFINTLYDDSVKKLDLIVIDKDINEYSCNYYFENKEETNKDNIYKSLYIDVKTYFFEENYMKMLKRLFSLMMIDKENYNTKEILKLFNSDTGKLYQEKSKLGTIKILLSVISNWQNDKNILKIMKKYKMKSEIEIDEKIKSLQKKININIKKWYDNL
jgi:hypothetical protein